MLTYLDNAQSSAQSPTRADPRDAMLEPAMLVSGSEPAANPQAKPTPAGKPRGLNENYARELLELHTLGIAGGYTEHDVREVARILTGWSFTSPGAKGRMGFEFAFKKKRHDMGAKTVLGQTFPAGQGEGEGIRLLRFLARHPATAQHLARKLCERFVADMAPTSCIAAASSAYLRSGGEMRDVVRAIASDPSFWLPQAFATKLKTPLEFVVSALRATNVCFKREADLRKLLGRLGEPLFEESFPIGYPDEAPAWSSTTGLLERMNFATSLGFGRLKGVELELSRVLQDGPDLLDQANRSFLSGTASASTLQAVARELAGVRASAQRLSLVTALFIGSPEFQLQ
jgi:uncharacterized protein (DUF1800 family)